jgi:hypothetical protein
MFYSLSSGRSAYRALCQRIAEDSAFAQLQTKPGYSDPEKDLRQMVDQIIAISKRCT